MADKWLKRNEKSPTEYTETHPSYGVIGISHVSGRGVLFGSEVTHQHYISITISEARRVVDEPREFVMSDRELIRVAMTAAQFGEMITSPNRGSGVPCTLERFTGDAGQPWIDPRHGGRPQPPSPEQYTKKYKGAMGERADTVSAHIKIAKDKADRLLSGEDKPTKASLKELHDALHMAQMNFDLNIPYVMEQMEEGIENRMAKAVTEFESYVGFSLQHKGLEHLNNSVPRLAVFKPAQLPPGYEGGVDVSEDD